MLDLAQVDRSLATGKSLSKSLVAKALVVVGVWEKRRMVAI
jgi:hypothetical protein